MEGGAVLQWGITSTVVVCAWYILPYINTSGYYFYYFYFQNSEVKLRKKEKLNFPYIRNKPGTLDHVIGTMLLAFLLLSSLMGQGKLKGNYYAEIQLLEEICERCV